MIPRTLLNKRAQISSLIQNIKYLLHTDRFRDPIERTDLFILHILHEIPTIMHI